jgi:NADPH2:quinone reductase
MKAIALHQALPISDPLSLVEVELERPLPGARDLLVKIEAIAVNPIDCKRRQALNPSGKPRVLGWDAAGVVEAVGEQVTLFRPGDRVYYAGDVTRPGCNAEYQCVDERIVGHMPATLSFEQAAALPLTTITAWEALFDRLRVPVPPHAQPPRSLLAIGGAGGVGSIALQLASRVAGLRVIATASRPTSRQWCLDHGAQSVVDHHGSLVDQVRALGLRYVDYVLIMNNTDQHFDAAAELVAPQGAICSIVSNAKPLRLEALRDKSAAFMWEAMFVRSKEKTPDMIEQHRLLNEVARLIDQGIVKTTLNEVIRPISAENLRRVHAQIESGSTIGKQVLSGF